MESDKPCICSGPDATCETFGARMARTTFHQLTPSEQEAVVAIKRAGADFMDMLHKLRKGSTDSEVIRWLSMAITHIDEGTTVGVKAVTADKAPVRCPRCG